MKLLVLGIFDPFNDIDFMFVKKLLKRNIYKTIYIQSTSLNIERANKIIKSYIYNYSKIQIYQNDSYDEIIEYNREIIIDKNLFSNQSKSSMHIIYNNLYYFEDIIKTMMDSKRFNHTLAVADLSYKLAKKHKLNAKKAYLTGLLHDCSKQAVDNLEIMNKYYEKYIHLDKLVYHQYTGAYYCHKYFKINDPDILNAIKGHTLHTDMSMYGMVLYIADKAELTRPYDTTKYISVAMDNLYKGFELVKKDSDMIFNEKKMVIK